MSYASQLPSFSADSHMLCQAASLRAYLTRRWNQAGRSFQLGVGDRSQVEPFRAEPSEGRADRINVCVCVRVGDSVWDSVPKRVREGSNVYLPQHNNLKKSVWRWGVLSHLLGDHRSLVSWREEYKRCDFIILYMTEEKTLFHDIRAMSV